MGVNSSTIEVPSLAVHEELNPKVWDGDHLKPEVRMALLRIAADFVDFLDVGEEPVDIRFTGSLANFNWSAQSDIDLHPVFDFARIDDDVELIKELLMAKKELWNRDHDVHIRGFEVECYPQDANEPHISTGIYSVLRDAWLVKPSREKPIVDVESVSRKASALIRMINSTTSDPGCSSECLNNVKQKIKKMRQCGLEKGGEFSVENLAFKLLRRGGYIDELWSTSNDRRDQQLSLDQ